MSLHRRNPKRDENERLIVETLRKRGFGVHRVSAPGFPDLVVTRRVSRWIAGTPAKELWLDGGARQVESFGTSRWCWFVEVKQPKGKLNAKQIAFRQEWQGPEILTLRSLQDAIDFPEGTKA